MSCVLAPVRPNTPDCQHGLVRRLDKLVAVAKSEGRKGHCPVCRAAASGARRDATGEDIRERWPGEWQRRDAALAEARDASRSVTAAEREAAEAEAAARGGG